MERLEAADPAKAKSRPLSPKQKSEIAEARQVAAARLAELEILYRDALKSTPEAAEREMAESRYLIDRKRIDDDCERKVDAIRRAK